MANSKNTKKDRDEKKFGDLSELNNSNSPENDSEFESVNSEFINKSSSSFDREEKNSKSAYASQINKSYGNSSNRSEDKKSNDTHKASFETDQQNENHESVNRRYTESPHQLSYDQQGRYQPPHSYQQRYEREFNQQPYQAYKNQNNYERYNNQESQRYQSRSHGQDSFNQNQFHTQRYPINQSSKRFDRREDSYYDQQQFQPQKYQEYLPQERNKSYANINDFENQQFINRGYENHNYNDQSNKLRS
ncbi:MAG TPA: hypothetical protein VLB84_16625, partial [Bacteroidia bacterium]|nr:hypothetical protein [Bacteroidia bacterium]